MTAKQLMEKSMMDNGPRQLGGRSYIFNQSEFTAFCEQLCREQREICAGRLEKGAMQDEVDEIINAQMPEL